MTTRVPLRRRSSLQHLKQSSYHGGPVQQHGFPWLTSRGTGPSLQGPPLAPTTRPARPVWHMQPLHGPANGSCQAQTPEHDPGGSTSTAASFAKGGRTTPPSALTALPPAEVDTCIHCDAAACQTESVARKHAAAQAHRGRPMVSAGDAAASCSCRCGCVTVDRCACRGSHIDLCVPARGWQLLLQRSPGRATKVRLLEGTLCGHDTVVAGNTLSELQRGLQRWMSRMEEVKRLLALQLGYNNVVRSSAQKKQGTTAGIHGSRQHSVTRVRIRRDWCGTLPCCWCASMWGSWRGSWRRCKRAWRACHGPPRMR